MTYYVDNDRQGRSLHAGVSNLFEEKLCSLYVADEAFVLDGLLKKIVFSNAERDVVSRRAASIVESLRRSSTKPPLIDQFLLEYGLSTQEGVILMRLAEALLRTPDITTSNLLIRDRLGAGRWKAHAGHAASGLVNLSTSGLVFSKSWIRRSGGIEGRSLIARLGDRVLSTAVNSAMVIMGEHFVLGRTIEDAIKKSDGLHEKGFSFSYDMLGEAAMTAKDAQSYYMAYKGAIEKLAMSGRTFGGLSVKLSALHPRYEIANADACVPELLAKLKALALIAKNAGLGLAIDAEEVERLELSLQIVCGLLLDPDLDGWDGLSIVVQAYQRRASAVIGWLVHEARKANRKICIRLVKGAYWDSEIKRAQEMGLESYPVFTRKENTDVSYLACARILFENADVLYPQFATHNAHTAAAILEMAPENVAYEFQCLHGMGEGLHSKLIKDFGVTSRIYAPVGKHADLLPYLVRRLLENGANSSFVNQLFDEAVKISNIVEDPQRRVEGHSVVANPALPAPRDYLGGTRLAAMGLDLTQVQELDRVAGWFDTDTRAYEPKRKSVSTSKILPILNPANSEERVGGCVVSTKEDILKATVQAQRSKWGRKSPKARADILRKVARGLEDARPQLLPLIVREAGKSLNDAVAEICEAVDFCRYYAQQCELDNCAVRKPIGVVACISPWNFPLAIFIGQIAANLACGNCVIAKPAEQTPLIARECVALLYKAGVPRNALHIVFGAGDIGAALVGAKDIAGVCFTGSTEVAKHISNALAQSNRGHTPLIAETGGINAMIVDSTALLEQVVRDVVTSSFQSAGQRCSACRLVCIQDNIADEFIDMLRGAMRELKIGDPSNPATDIGPVIDKAAAEMLRAYIVELKARGQLIKETDLPRGLQSDLFVAPIAVELGSIADITQEMFGPVLHVVRFKSGAFENTISEINRLGFGLTMGLHTRIDSRVDAVSEKACVGNLYVNRNQIGAVVGVQPFGGEGLSGTGPKAGGPHYLYRLTHNEHGVQSVNQNITLEQTTLRPEKIAKLKQVLASAHIAKQAWDNMDRGQILRGVAKRIAVTKPQLAKAFEKAADLASTVFGTAKKLPGPTGEENTLKLVPRGVIVCLQGIDLEAHVDVIAMALAAGNALVLEDARLIPDIKEALLGSAAPEHILQSIDPGMGVAALDQRIDGVIVDVGLVNAVQKYLCKRPGALLPVLVPDDEYYRFVMERTLTIDTTAAGGNASLLAAL